MFWVDVDKQTNRTLTSLSFLYRWRIVNRLCLDLSLP